MDHSTTFGSALKTVSNETVTIGGVTAECHFFTVPHVVEATRQRVESTTSVSGGGGGGYISEGSGKIENISISSSTSHSVTEQIWLHPVNSTKEIMLELINSDFHPRDGHHVSLLHCAITSKLNEEPSHEYPPVIFGGRCDETGHEFEHPDVLQAIQASLPTVSVGEDPNETLKALLGLPSYILGASLTIWLIILLSKEISDARGMVLFGFFGFFIGLAVVGGTISWGLVSVFSLMIPGRTTNVQRYKNRVDLAAKSHRDRQEVTSSIIAIAREHLKKIP